LREDVGVEEGRKGKGRGRRTGKEIREGEPAHPEKF